MDSLCCLYIHTTDIPLSTRLADGLGGGFPFLLIGYTPKLVLPLPNLRHSTIASVLKIFYHRSAHTSNKTKPVPRCKDHNLRNVHLSIHFAAKIWLASLDSIYIFAFGENYGCHQFLNWWQQQSTGLLHLDGFESALKKRQRLKQQMLFKPFWQHMIIVIRFQMVSLGFETINEKMKP